MAEVKLRALGLREVDFGDFDRYLTALTEDGRRIEILCKNARRGKKQNPAARQLCYSEFILSDRGGRYTLRDADLVHSFFALAGDIEKYALSCYLNELTTACCCTRCMHSREANATRSLSRRRSSGALWPRAAMRRI